MGSKPIWKEALEHDRAAGIIMKDSEVFLIHRLRNGMEYWCFPGGTVDGGEGVEEALYREMAEELGITVKKEKFSFKVKNAGRFEHYFIIEEYDGIIGREIGGPEAERMDADNQYIFTWVPLRDVGSIVLLPEEAKREFISMFVK